MKRILGEAKSVRSLLSEKYGIDYYQREYKWEAKQVRELIEDLTTRFLREFNPNHEPQAVAGYGQYFLGSIIVSEKNGKRLIVDGQQRLTSLTLLLIFLDRLQQNQDPNDRVEVTNFIYSVRHRTKSFNLDVDERNDTLQKLIDSDDPDPKNQTLSVQNLINRFNDIADLWPDNLREDALPYFLDWLIDNVMMVEITAFSDDDAYTIFETMNDRGLSLSPTDMLKGHLLANITSNETRNRAESDWKGQIVKLREFGKDEDADCIKAWLRSQYADNIRERRAGAQPADFDKLGTEFHRWVREHGDRIGLANSGHFSSFITEQFRFYARAYRRARRAADRYTNGLTSVYFNAQNSFTLQYPLMLAPLQISDDSKTVRNKMRAVAMFIEIMLARRIWNFKAIDHSTMQYRAFLIMKGIRGLQLDELCKNLIHRLSPEGADQEDYIDFHTEEAFRLHGNNRPQVHRLLARMTEFLEVQSGEQSRYTEYANRASRRGGYQIEHIWADHPERHQKDFDHPNDFATYRHRIGGLVLLPAGENASYSDMKYKDKVEHYTKQNLLACSLHPIAYKNKPDFQRFIRKTGLEFKRKKKFRKADLDDRQKLYIELANLCWSPDRIGQV